MKTKNGKYDLNKVEKTYTQLKEKLTKDELKYLLHLLIKGYGYEEKIPEKMLSTINHSADTEKRR